MFLHCLQFHGDLMTAVTWKLLCKLEQKAKAELPDFFKKFFILFFCFLGLQLQHMEIPRLGVQLEPQLQHLRVRAKSATYTTAHCKAGSLTPEGGQRLNLCPHGY